MNAFSVGDPVSFWDTRPMNAFAHLTILPRVIVLAILWIACLARAEDAKPAVPEEGGASLGDLFSKVKDLKVPESVSSLPAQLAEMKESYVETAKTVDALRAEVEELRAEVYALKTSNAELREAVGVKVATTSREEILKPIEVSAADLAKDWRDHKDLATDKFGGRYLRVVGVVDSFESATQELILILRGDEGTRVRCRVPRDANFHVEVLASQGRLVDRNNRATVLAVGQPVAVLGTCDGINLDVLLSTCRVEGIEVKRNGEQNP
jgi:regulator of replication initiation timing